MLRYVDDTTPGITRRRLREKWAYFAPDGAKLGADDSARLNKLAVPPAYRDVWFCPDPRGHLQATGIDARGRKQYRYHPDFRADREAQKYAGCAGFGRALPKLRKRVECDLGARGLERDRVVAAVVRLLDSRHLRVGNEAYAKENRSFGATTLRRRHARVGRDTLRLSYTGKHGKRHDIGVRDPKLVSVVRRCQDLPGQHLFQYIGADGAPHAVGSSEVNAYVREVMGDDYSAKHFRTWGASVIAFETLAASDEPPTLTALLERVSAALGNTPAVARKSYVHPALLEVAKTGDLAAVRKAARFRTTRHLSAAERGLIAFLDRLPR
jgi:DNA topoisomerase-1